MTHIGVLDHEPDPTFAHVTELAEAAEEAGADWLTFPDVASRRDVWMCAGLAVQSTERILVGPGVTNPYLRHPMHTISAIATLHDLSGGRALLGIGAGGAVRPDGDATMRGAPPQRVAELVELMRAVAAGEPLDAETGLRLGFELPSTPVLVAARRDHMLRCAGAHADWALVFRIPLSDIDRTVGEIRAGAVASGREAGPDIVWCPLVAWHRRIEPHLRAASVYSTLENPAHVCDRWGLDQDRRDRIRALVADEGVAAAADLVPDEVVRDVILPDPDPEAVAEVGRSIGATTVAIRNFDSSVVGEGVEWARAVTARLWPAGGPPPPAGTT